MKFNTTLKVLEDTIRKLESRLDKYQESTWETIEKGYVDGKRKENRQDELSNKIAELQAEIDELTVAIEYLSYIDNADSY